jgi:hypothetical protein
MADRMSAVSIAWDRRGAEQPRREAAGPERSGAPDSPVFCGAAAKNAPKVLKK